nr:AlpA family transcriptional regulator [Dyella sp. C11]
MDTTINDERFLKLPEVRNSCGISRTQVYKLMGEGRFPQSIKLSTRSVAWPQSKVREWMAGRVASSAKSKTSS